LLEPDFNSVSPYIVAAVPLKVDVMLSNSVVDAAPRARELEATGVDGVFSFENAHDLFFPLVAAAPVCSLDLMTNVAIAFPRSPMHLAHAAYDLHLLSKGRFRLGLGSQVRAHVEKRFGARWGKPVAQMREWVLATKAILQSWQVGSRVDFRGDYTTHTLMTPAFNPGPNPHGIPKILVGALGPRMNEMAAEVADGILVMPFNSDRHMCERTVPAIERGLAAGGRRRDDIELTAEVIVGVGRTDEELEAARAVSFLLAFYGSTPAYRPVLEVEGWGDLQPELNTLSKRGDWAKMTELISDDMVRTIAVFGTPDQVADEIVARFGDCDRICAYFPGYQAGDDLIADFTAAVKAASASS
jgi:probable F420-dependent oxidoreductase